jgi:hypothetical protein
MRGGTCHPFPSLLSLLSILIHGFTMSCRYCDIGRPFDVLHHIFLSLTLFLIYSPLLSEGCMYGVLDVRVYDDVPAAHLENHPPM